jgi:hypothetical protein
VKSQDSQERIPREFSRLLAYSKGTRAPSGLDEGDDSSTGRIRKPSNKDGARSSQDVNATASAKPLTIRPGERLADYSTRVDAALPVGGLVKKGTKKIPGIKPYQTKLERRIQRMQKQWREEDAKIKEQRREAAEELEDELDDTLPGVGARLSMFGSKSTDDDPWAELAKARAQKVEPSRGLTGVHDVVQAPPSLKPQRARIKDGRHIKRDHI